MLFCNIDFNVKNKNELFEHANDNITKIIITANAGYIVEANTSKRFFDIFKNNNVTIDGQIPCLMANLLNRKCKLKKMSGSDIVYDFCELAKRNNFSFFFLGGNNENNKIAVKRIKDEYNIAVDGYSPDFEEYPFSEQFNDLCMKKILNFKPDILFVAFGKPKQEYWMDDHKEELSVIGVKYVVGCGGTIDFVSKKIKRAPIFIQKMGLEFLYRFFQAPSLLRVKRMLRGVRFFKYIFHKPDFINS